MSDGKEEAGETKTSNLMEACGSLLEAPGDLSGFHDMEGICEISHHPEGPASLLPILDEGGSIGGTSYICSECGKSFCSISSLISHQKRNHSGEDCTAFGNRCH